MNKNSFKIFLGVFFILVFFVTVLFLIIQLNVFPELTKIYNECVAKIFLEKNNPEFKDSVPVQKEKIILQNGSVDFQSANLSFIPVENFSEQLNEFVSVYNIDGVEFILSENNLVLQGTGILKRFNSSYDSSNPEVESWTFKNEYPIITSLAFYQNCIVFIDASLQVHCLDIFTGDEIFNLTNSENKIFSPVYPSGKTFAFENAFVFEGMNKNLFALSFVNHEELELQVVQNKTDFSIFEISPEAKTHIKDYVANWLSLTEEFDLPSVKILPDGIEPLPLDDENLIIYAYCPDWSGIKTIGLCDENSSWIKSYTFVSIFTDAGELRGVSMDYVADSPQLELHHSTTDENFYYFVIGKLPHNEDTHQRFFTIK